jgi:hypothetical protein
MTFQSMQGMVRKKKIWPHVRAIRSVNGEQEIRFKNGSVIMFGAREQGFGRGFDQIDAEVFDEAQILTAKALEDMVPATNASKQSRVRSCSSWAPRRVLGSGRGVHEPSRQGLVGQGVEHGLRRAVGGP